jgi:hypothetical protein
MERTTRKTLPGSLAAVPAVNVSIDIDWKLVLVLMLWHFGQRLL